jgi:hypothetical protein
VTSGRTLTAEDLDEIGEVGFEGRDANAIAAGLVEAVDNGRLADRTDAGFALMLAAEAMEHAGDLAAAAALAGRAAEAYQADDFANGCALARRGELLIRLGRSDAGMAELTALRPRLLEDPDAASYLSEALEKAGHAVLAERWLTEAALATLDRRMALVATPEDPAFGEVTVLAFSLLQERHQIRHELEQPHDELDGLLETFDGDLVRGAVLFWPRAEYDRALLLWPALADVCGASWDAHRAGLEQALVLGLEEEGESPLLLTGSVDGLMTYALDNDGDPMERTVLDGYLASVLARTAGVRWPPGRNDACWCRSGSRYESCCLPRGQG